MRVVSIVAIALSLGLALPALAQPAPLHVKKDTDAPQVKVIKRGDRTIFKFTRGLVLYGKAHRPHAVMVLERERRIYESRQPTQSLGFRITEAVRRSPF